MKGPSLLTTKEGVTQSWVTAISRSERVRRLSPALSLGVGNMPNFDQFKKSFEYAIQRITSYLPFQLDKKLDKFSYLIAREGEDNQNKAEAMLNQYPALIPMV